MVIKPKADFIHVKVEKLDKVLGIEVPQSVDYEEEIIEVVSVGPDVTLVKGGERVLPRPGMGIRAIVGGKEAVFIRESDIMAIISED